MEQDYWVGIMKGLGYVLYDKEGQTCSPEKVVMYVFSKNAIDEFDRSKARESVKTEKNTDKIEPVIEAYLNWKRSTSKNFPQKALSNQENTSRSTLAGSKKRLPATSQNQDSGGFSLDPSLISYFRSGSSGKPGLLVGWLFDNGYVVYDPNIQERDKTKNIKLFLVSLSIYRTYELYQLKQLVTKFQNESAIEGSINDYMNWCNDSGKSKKPDKKEKYPWDGIDDWFGLSSYEYDKLRD